MKIALALLAATGALTFAPAFAAELIATLEVSSPRQTQTATSAPRDAKPGTQLRPVCQGKADEELTLRWKARSSAKRPLEEVLVHFFVARENQLGQKEAPNLRSKATVLEGALTMDFNATNSATGLISFKLHDPGAYLVRVELQHAPGLELEEPSASVDVEVK